MTLALRSQARTSHLIREEIRTATPFRGALARRRNVTRQTIGKWQGPSTAGRLDFFAAVA